MAAAVALREANHFLMRAERADDVVAANDIAFPRLVNS